MPFYEYQCNQCSHLFEAMQKISEPPLKKCPACGKNALKKLISAPVFRLKGSGWYETDFKSDQEKKRNLADAEPAASSGAGADKAEKADKPKSEAAAGNAEAKPAAAASPESSSATPAAAASKGESSGASSGGKRRSSGGATARGSSKPSPARPAKRAAPAKRAKSTPRRASVRARR